jgi:hypothetical protein
MSAEPDSEPDPQLLLPEAIRDKWAVVPRFELYQLSIMMALIGAGAALSIVGVVQGPSLLKPAFFVALLIGYVQNRIFSRRADRMLVDLEEYIDD